MLSGSPTTIVLTSRSRSIAAIASRSCLSARRSTIPSGCAPIDGRISDGDPDSAAAEIKRSIGIVAPSGSGGRIFGHSTRPWFVTQGCVESRQLKSIAPCQINQVGVRTSLLVVTMARPRTSIVADEPMPRIRTIASSGDRIFEARAKAGLRLTLRKPISQIGLVANDLARLSHGLLSHDRHATAIRTRSESSRRADDSWQLVEMR